MGKNTETEAKIGSDELHRWEFPEPLALNPDTSGYLDAIRALAALLVMFGHWRGFCFVDYGHIEGGNATRFVKSLYAVTAFGHQCVMVFFVLSGLFISSSIFRNIRRRRWSWKDYAIDRGVRLYVVLIPGLLLGLLWDSLGIEFLNGTGLYSAALMPFGDNVPAQSLSPTIFLGNLLFLQTRFTSVFGSNGPLWSLFNEFWYYLLFPALIGLIMAFRTRAAKTGLWCVLISACAGWILRYQLLGFVVWLSGCGVAMTARYGRFSNSAVAVLYTVCASAVFCVALVSSRTDGFWLGSDLAVGLSFACALHGVLQLRIPLGAVGRKAAKTFAGFSYSLYVLHFPLLLFIKARWIPGLRWQPDIRHLLYGLAISVGVVLYAFTVAQMTELRTPAIRSWIRDRLSHERI